MTEIRTQPLVGTRYIRYAICVDGVEVHSQLSPYSEAEIEQRLAAHLRHEPVRPVREVIYKANHGRKAKVNERGFTWDKQEENE